MGWACRRALDRHRELVPSLRGRTRARQRSIAWHVDSRHVMHAAARLGPGWPASGTPGCPTPAPWPSLQSGTVSWEGSWAAAIGDRPPACRRPRQWPRCGCRRAGARAAALLVPIAGVDPLRASCSSMRKPGNAADRPAPSFLTQEQREALDAALSKKRAEQREHG